jgi:hypothetical protein
MSPALAGVALAVTAGAVIAASSREARAALVGLALALGLGPFLADPLPGAAVLGARVVTGILVVYLLWVVAAGEDVRGLGSRIGWPAETLLALGVAVAGVAIASGLATLAPGGPGRPEDAGLIDSLTPSALALAAGLASLVVGLAPAVLGRRGFRTGIGLLLVVQGIVLARTGLAGPPGELEQLGIDGLVLTLGASAALIAVIERRTASDAGGLEAGGPEAVGPDHGRLDAGRLDAGRLDAGRPDAASPHAHPPTPR